MSDDDSVLRGFSSGFHGGPAPSGFDHEVASAHRTGQIAGDAARGTNNSGYFSTSATAGSGISFGGMGLLGILLLLPIFWLWTVIAGKNLDHYWETMPAGKEMMTNSTVSLILPGLARNGLPRYYLLTPWQHVFIAKDRCTSSRCSIELTLWEAEPGHKNMSIIKLAGTVPAYSLTEPPRGY
jgi:hypothetical protein